MADKKYFANIDGSGVIQLKGVRIQAVNDETSQNELEQTGNNGSELGAANTGLQIYRVDLGKTLIWDGSKFVKQAIQIDGDVVFKGLFDANIPLDDPGQPQTIEASAGNQYVVNASGTFDPGSSGISLNGEQELETGDKILFVSDTEAYAFQTNVDEATETTRGNIRLATETEVSNGTNDTTAVTPLKLSNHLTDILETVPRSFSTTISVGSNDPEVVEHGLNLENQNSFIFYAMLDGSAVSVDVDSVDNNTITVTSLVAIDNLVVTVIGKEDPQG